MFTDAQIRSFRARFSIFKRKIYLGSCSQGALSDAVEAGIAAHLSSWHEHGLHWDFWMERYESTRAAFAKLIGAKPEEVAIVTSVSAAIQAIANALRFGKRNRVVMGEFEFPTMGHVWMAQKARGASVEILPSRDGRMWPDTYAQSVDEHTLVVPVTGVCFMNGARSPVKEIAQVAHDQGALVMQDDYQDAGTRPINVRASDVDFYCTGALKYLLGSSGLAFLYVKEELLDKLDPTLGSWLAQVDPFAYDLKRYSLATTARKLETGTPPILPIYAAEAAIGLLQQIGLEDVEIHIKSLAQQLMTGAAELGIAVKTPEGTVGPLVVLKTQDIDRVLARLAERGLVASSRHDGLRIAFHAYNTAEDVSVLLAALKENLDLMVRTSSAAA